MLIWRDVSMILKFPNSSIEIFTNNIEQVCEITSSTLKHFFSLFIMTKIYLWNICVKTDLHFTECYFLYEM